MRGVAADKILVPLCGKPVVVYSLEAFIESEVADHFVFVYRDEAQKGILKSIVEKRVSGSIKTFWVQGGEERQDSVYHALQTLSPSAQHVFIHDCARPLVVPAALRSLLDIVREDRAVCLAHPVKDSIKELASEPDASLRKLTLQNIERDLLWAMETPQVFDRELITASYRKLIEKNARVTDDTAAVAANNHPVSLLENHAPNPKLTSPEDFLYLEFLIKRQSSKEKR